MGRAAASSGTGGARSVFPLRLHLLPRHQPHVDLSTRNKTLNCSLRVVATVLMAWTRRGGNSFAIDGLLAGGGQRPGWAHSHRQMKERTHSSRQFTPRTH